MSAFGAAANSPMLHEPLKSDEDRNALVGKRVRMTGAMPNDPDPIPVGAEGTITYVSKLYAGLVAGCPEGDVLSVDWDSGRKLQLLPVDPYEVLS